MGWARLDVALTIALHLCPSAAQATLDVHWGKHHRAYVTNLNNQIKGKPLENKTLEEVWDAMAVSHLP